MRGDLSVQGLQSSFPVAVAASSTRFEVGEPLHNTGSYSSGANSTNVFVLAAADTPVVGTHNFGGVASEPALPFGTGTLVDQFTVLNRPVPNVGLIRGKAESAAAIDTAAELSAILMDAVLIDYNATGATDGGELYTIKNSASADTSGLTIVNGNTSTGTLDVTLDPRACRNDVT